MFLNSLNKANCNFPHHDISYLNEVPIFMWVALHFQYIIFPDFIRVLFMHHHHHISNSYVCVNIFIFIHVSLLFIIFCCLCTIYHIIYMLYMQNVHLFLQKRRNVVKTVKRTEGIEHATSKPHKKR